MTAPSQSHSPFIEENQVFAGLYPFLSLIPVRKFWLDATSSKRIHLPEQLSGTSSICSRTVYSGSESVLNTAPENLQLLLYLFALQHYQLGTHGLPSFDRDESAKIVGCTS
jgi:hypothetical protein